MFNAVDLLMVLLARKLEAAGFFVRINPDNRTDWLVQITKAHRSVTKNLSHLSCSQSNLTLDDSVNEAFEFLRSAHRESFSKELRTMAYRYIIKACAEQHVAPRECDDRNTISFVAGYFLALMKNDNVPVDSIPEIELARELVVEYMRGKLNEELNSELRKGSNNT